MTHKRRTRLFVKLEYFLLVLEIAVSSEQSLGDPFTPADCELWNAALCKPAFQNTLWGIHTPDRAVNGNRNTSIESGNCALTNGYEGNWWMVDLTDEYLVHKVIITNRADGYSWRFKMVNVELHLSDPRFNETDLSDANGTLCVQIVSAFNGTVSFDCASPTYARYVLLAKYYHWDINVCEVEVMVSKKRGDTNCRETISGSFNVARDSVVESGETVVSTKTRTALACVDLCKRQGYLCNGCYWIEDTKDCQLLKIDPYNLGPVVNKDGTDFYFETPIQCAGNGVWGYVV